MCYAVSRVLLSRISRLVRVSLGFLSLEQPEVSGLQELFHVLSQDDLPMSDKVVS